MHAFAIFSVAKVSFASVLPVVCLKKKQQICGNGCLERPYFSIFFLKALLYVKLCLRAENPHHIVGQKRKKTTE